MPRSLLRRRPRQPPESFEARALRIAHIFEKVDHEHQNWMHVRGVREHQLYRPGVTRNTAYNHARVLGDFVETHALLEMVSRGRLAGKHILQLGASTGVYARYLQQHCGAKAVPIDIDYDALHTGKSRGVRHGVQGSAIKQERMGTPDWVLSKKGVLVPNRITVGLPFRTNSFDFVVCDHFLFASYDKAYTPPGFEEHENSISRSEDNLTELNRVIRRGGRVITTSMHGNDLPDLVKYQKHFRIHGFQVEHVFTERLNPQLHLTAPTLMVMRKIGSAAPRKRKLVLS